MTLSMWLCLLYWYDATCYDLGMQAIDDARSELDELESWWDTYNV